MPELKIPARTIPAELARGIIAAFEAANAEREAGGLDTYRDVYEYHAARENDLLQDYYRNLIVAPAPTPAPTPAPPPNPDHVPQTVTARQAHSALRIAGKYDLVIAAIAAIQDPVQRGLMEDEFHKSQTFERQRPALLQLAAGIGLTSEEIDALFKLAATL